MWLLQSSFFFSNTFWYEHWGSQKLSDMFQILQAIMADLDSELQSVESHHISDEIMKQKWQDSVGNGRTFVGTISSGKMLGAQDIVTLSPVKGQLSSFVSRKSTTVKVHLWTCGCAWSQRVEGWLYLLSRDNSEQVRTYEKLMALLRWFLEKSFLCKHFFPSWDKCKDQLYLGTLLRVFSWGPALGKTGWVWSEKAADLLHKICWVGTGGCIISSTRV